MSVNNQNFCLTLLGCDFDNGLCYGWADDHYQDVFDWTNLHGPTPSYNTGPSSGHGGFGKLVIPAPVSFKPSAV